METEEHLAALEHKKGENPDDHQTMKENNVRQIKKEKQKPIIKYKGKQQPTTRHYTQFQLSQNQNQQFPNSNPTIPKPSRKNSTPI